MPDLEGPAYWLRLLTPPSATVFSTTDTIVAIATPPGRGGIGVLRVSGPDARSIARALTTCRDPLRPRHATLTKVRLKPDTTHARHPDSYVASAFRRTSSEGSDVASGFSRTSPESGDVASGADRITTEAIDQVVATYFPAPASYTGEDVVEIGAHGSPVVLRAIVTAAIEAGARLAEPGEFTLRAFLNGRIDLAQAEAIGDLIDAVTPLQARAAFDQLQGTLTAAIGGIDAALFDLVARLEASIDFPDEGYHFVEPDALRLTLDELILRADRLLADAARGRLVREGLQIAIAGKPNVGKSSLFNALVGASRAIVTDTPGTTRDLLTEVVDLDGLRVTLVDTAGVRETMDAIEREGVRRARQAQTVADLLLVVVDGSASLDEEDCDLLARTADSRRLLVQNKTDLAIGWESPDAVPVSAVTHAGIPELRRAICRALDVEPRGDAPGITNVRHIALVRRARKSIVRARDAAAAPGRGRSEEFVLADLQDARAALEEISGRRVPDDLLAHIFSRFCIGK